MIELLPGQFEHIGFPYGVPFGNSTLVISHDVAQGMANELVGMESRQLHESGKLARIVSTHLDGNEQYGLVVSICEFVVESQPPEAQS